MKTAIKLLLLACCGWAGIAGVLRAGENAEENPALRKKLAQVILSEGAEQQTLLEELGGSNSRIVRDVLTAWSRDSVFVYENPAGAKVPVLLDETTNPEGKSRAVVISDGLALKDDAGSPLLFSATDLNSAETDARTRIAIQQTLDLLALSDPDPALRRTATVKFGNSQKEKYLPILDARLALERDESVRKMIYEAMAQIQLNSSNRDTQIAAIHELARLESIAGLDAVRRVTADRNAPPEVARAGKKAVEAIEAHIRLVNLLGTVFRGLSLGSILLVVALGLAITFGLMGIINMAHGEMIAVGAYTCYVVQNLFGAGFSFSINLPFHWFGRPLGFGLHLPGLNAAGWFYESYFLFALPLSFLMAALAGLALERCVIRFLYRRPLESLLATWGVSLVMQQGFRMVFGANNVQVNSPSWLQGHFTVFDVLFGYNRVFVIAFAAVIVAGAWLLLTRTSLGLLIRAVMQNRDMAACMGVRTTRVNMLTFALGSGLAGFAGAFLSQIGNVGPSLGQSYIVDSFMTVVVGGVGSIAGTVCSSVAIGTADQTLQQILGSPVMGKILVLGAIILFLQWKPGGLFSVRSRNLD